MRICRTTGTRKHFKGTESVVDVKKDANDIITTFLPEGITINSLELKSPTNLEIKLKTSLEAGIKMNLGMLSSKEEIKAAVAKQLVAFHEETDTASNIEVGEGLPPEIIINITPKKNETIASAIRAYKEKQAI